MTAGAIEINQKIEEYAASNNHIARLMRGEHTPNQQPPHLVFERLPDSANVISHFSDIKKDLHFFAETCGIEITQDIVDTCLFWRVKTGQSLATLAEDIICQNLSLMNSGWFTPASRLERSNSFAEGKATVVTGLPGFGKSRFLNELNQPGDLLPIDSDTFRFFTLVKPLLDIDGNLFPQTPQGQWEKSQHAYCTPVNKAYRLLAEAVACPLKLHGQDLGASGIPLTALADYIFWVESDELPMQKFLGMDFPAEDSIVTLAQQSQTEEQFFENIQDSQFKDVIAIVKRKIDERTKNVGHVTGALPWDDPLYQPLLQYQASGANPKMNLFDIALTVIGIQQDIRTLIRQPGVTIHPIVDHKIPDGRALLQQLMQSEGPIASITPQSHRLPHVPSQDILHPSKLQSLRLQALAVGQAVISRIPDKLSTQISKITSSDGPEIRWDVQSVAQRKMEEVLRGLANGSTPGSIQAQIFKDIPSEKQITSLLAQVLVTDLTLLANAEEEGAKTLEAKFIYPNRWEPSMESWIASPVHSFFELPTLGILLQGDGYDDYHRVADAVHDNREEATQHVEENGILKKGVRYSSSALLSRNLLAKLIKSSSKYGPFAAYCADLLTEAAPESYYRTVYAACEHLFSNELIGNYFDALDGAIMGADLDRRSYEFGPIRFALLAMQESLGAKGLIQGMHLQAVNPSETSAFLSCALRDRLPDVQTLHRYLDLEFMKLTPPQARIKIITYTSRLFSTYSYLLEAYNALPPHMQQNLASTVKSFLPSLFWNIREVVNPQLQSHGLAPIQDKELFKFYWQFYAPLVEKLHPLLEPFATARAKSALARCYPHIDSSLFSFK